VGTGYDGSIAADGGFPPLGLGFPPPLGFLKVGTFATAGVGAFVVMYCTGGVVTGGIISVGVVATIGLGVGSFVPHSSVQMDLSLQYSSSGPQNPY